MFWPHELKGDKIDQINTSKTYTVKNSKLQIRVHIYINYRANFEKESSKDPQIKRSCIEICA